MHPRNPYNEPPDFADLARRYPPLRPHVFINHTGSSTINFKSLPAQRRLTEALFHLDYGLSLTLPDDRLCPPVPNRLNYVLWLQDIVKSTCGSDTIRGLDIGTGASAIYPLLACRIEPTWNFVTTDIDERSVQFAKQNISRNSMDSRIFVEHVPADGPILQPLHTSSTGFDFTMCNPPFYSSAEDVSRSTEFKELGPNAVCSGAEVEMITPGGETSFVARIFSESLQLRTKCRWYTSMLGKMSSIPDIVSLFREHSVDNYAITEFVQGQTRRWAIGWSFQDARLPDTFARISNPTLKNIMPSRNTLHHAFPGARSVDILASALRSVIALINGVTVASSATPATSEHSFTMLVHAQSNTWSRAARRGKLPEIVCASQESPVLRCSIESRERLSSYTSRDIPCQLVFIWVEGKDRLIFESFASHVSRQITSTLPEFGDVI
ncbi:S-adenosyl-L-methionine dependent methyltransferase [Suillus clintonianus]|uniref:S-adenosyl-L-methionine dependent methyltransferase n=1 Tax=Suillus clintonianus TaxID=1904413 RepID=UPI001B86C4D2|nr:S-adenosyl-L-methionine dependent methyltransferase [Suillus clintonianus]KAG2137497.1 S-adenosyl-L-methionine dependent methyltransferase [Suillus clintonianus]